MPTRIAWSAVLPLFWAHASAWACPFCGTPTSQKVQAGIFNDQFAYNLVATLSPFPILALIIALIFVGLPKRRSNPKG